MIKSPFILVLLFLWIPAAKQVNIDSLLSAWHDNSAPDTSRIQAIHDISKYGYLYSQPDSAQYFAQLMYDFAFEKGLERDMASALNLQGASCLIRGRFDEALKYYEQSVLIFEKVNDKSSM